jgi:hypothetical protein
VRPAVFDDLMTDGPFVAGHPTRAVACYWGPLSSPTSNAGVSKRVGPGALATITEILNAAPEVGPEIVSCPMDDGQDMFFRLSQAGSPTEEILVSLTGCRSAYNGVRSVWLRADASDCIAVLSGFTIQGGTNCQSA